MCISYKTGCSESKFWATVNCKMTIKTHTWDSTLYIGLLYLRINLYSLWHFYFDIFYLFFLLLQFYKCNKSLVSVHYSDFTITQNSHKCLEFEFPLDEDSHRLTVSQRGTGWGSGRRSSFWHCYFLGVLLTMSRAHPKHKRTDQFHRL